MDLSRPLTDHHEICTQVSCGVKPENLSAKSFYPTPKNLAGENSNFDELPPTRRQPESRNFETAPHIDKQNPDVSSTINALKTVPNMGHHPTGF